MRPPALPQPPTALPPHSPTPPHHPTPSPRGACCGPGGLSAPLAQCTAADWQYVQQRWCRQRSVLGLLPARATPGPLQAGHRFPFGCMQRSRNQFVRGAPRRRQGPSAAAAADFRCDNSPRGPARPIVAGAGSLPAQPAPRRRADPQSPAHVERHCHRHRAQRTACARDRSPGCCKLRRATQAALKSGHARARRETSAIGRTDTLPAAREGSSGASVRAGPRRAGRCTPRRVRPPLAWQSRWPRPPHTARGRGRGAGCRRLHPGPSATPQPLGPQ
jgi:hypothetical protein